MSSLVLKLAIRGTVSEALACNGIGGNTLLNPLHDGFEDVVLGGLATQVGHVVSNTVCTIATRAVTTAADAEVSVEFIQLSAVQAHVENLRSTLAEFRQVALPGLDVEGVDFRGLLVVVGSDLVG
ncbi:hypothetical protein LB507_005020, partial [Fusarium sp. FIESC RH6]